MLKDLSEVVAGFSQLHDGYLFQPSTFNPVQLLTCTFTPSFSFNWAVFSLSNHLMGLFFQPLWSAQRYLLSPFDFGFVAPHQCHFAMLIFQIPTHYSVFLLCSLKPYFLSYSLLHHMWFVSHADLGSLEHWKYENMWMTRTSHPHVIFCNKLASVGP